MGRDDVEIGVPAGRREVIAWRVLALCLGASVVPGIQRLAQADRPAELGGWGSVAMMALTFGPVFIGGLAAWRLGRSPLGWAFGSLLWGLPLLFLGALGPRRPGANGTCPGCGSDAVDAASFGGEPLAGAPARGDLQVHQHRRCRECGRWFVPPVFTPGLVGALLLVAILVTVAALARRPGLMPWVILGEVTVAAASVFAMGWRQAARLDAP